MASERLDIVISETGSTAVASAMRAIATAVEGAGSSLDFLKKALKDLKVGDVKTSLDAVTVATGKLGTKAKQTGVKVQNFTKTMGHLNSTNKAVVKSSGDSEKALKDLKRAFTRVAPAAKGAGSAVKAAGTQAKIGAHGFGSMTRQVFILKSTFATLGGIALARGILSMSDAYQNLGNRLRLVTKGTKSLVVMRRKLFKIAIQTRQSAESTIETYVRLRKATKGLGLSDNKVAGTLKTINQMLTLSGASAMESSQSMLQLSQAFSKGKLDGDEFKSVAENMPDIIDALSESLGVTRNRIRTMAATGQITSKVMVKAFNDVAESVDKKLGDSVSTLGQAWENLKTSALQTVGASNESTGAANKLVAAIKLLSENLDLVVDALKLTALWLGTKLVVATSTWAAAMMSKLVNGAIPKVIGAIRGLSAAGALLGLGALTAPLAAAAAAALAAAAAYKLLRTEVKKTVEGRSDGETQFLTLIAKEEAALKRLRLLQKFSPNNNTRTALASRVVEMEKELALSKELLKNAKARQDQVEKIGLAKDSQREANVALKDMIIAERKVNKALERQKTLLKVIGDASAVRTGSATDYVELESTVKKMHEDQINPVQTLVKQAEHLRDLAKMTNKERLKAIAYAKAEAAVRKATGGFTFFLNKVRGDDANQIESIRLIAEADIATQRANKSGSASNKIARERAKRLKKAIDFQKQLNENLHEMRSALDSTYEAQRAWLTQSNKIEELRAHGKIGDDEKNRALALQAKLLNDVKNPQDEMIKGLEAELAMLELLPQARKKYARMLELTTKFRSAGQGVGEADSNAQEVYQLEQKLNAQNAIRSATDALAESTRKAGQAMADADLVLAGGGTRLEHREAVLAAISMRSTEHAAAVGKVTESLSKQVPVADQLNQQMAVWSELAAHGGINAEVLANKLASLKKQIEETKQSTTGWSAAMRSLNESTYSAAAVQSQFVSAVSGVYQNMEDTMVNFATGQKVVWKDMVDSMISDFMRLLIRMAIMKTVSAIGGASAMPGLTARHGMNKHVGADLPRFAHGGSMHVGGSGGPDSKLVQFMASPGERVQVTNPGQSRLDSGNQAPAAPPTVNITNVVDPSEYAAALTSPAGERAIINVVENNADLFRRFLK